MPGGEGVTDGEGAATGRRLGRGGILVALVIAGAVAFIILNVIRDLAPARVNTATKSHFSCSVLSVYDGDGPINCSEVDQDGQPVQIRLRGIEAREPDDSCYHTDICPKASGAEAKAELTRLAVGRLQCVSFGPSYGRVDARCTNESGVDISCAMLKSGKAVRWPEYDPDGLLIPCVPAEARHDAR